MKIPPAVSPRHRRPGPPPPVFPTWGQVAGLWRCPQLRSARFACAQAAATGSITGRVFDASRGEYLENARVTVAGLPFEAFTDASGTFEITHLPAGPARVTVFFTGRNIPTQTVTVVAGQATTLDLTVGSEPGRATPEGETILLNEFVTTATKEMEAAAIAINEQRFAADIRHVVAADEFGTIVDGTPGEALKFLPGITLNYSAGEARSISINGVPDVNVPVTVGGFELASAASNGTSRIVNLDQISINSMSRIEVLHSPTPESPGSALAGSVNLVPRSAFERSKPVFNYSAYLMMKHSDRHFAKTPGPFHDDYPKVTPGMNFSLIMPVNKRFGFTLSGNHATQFAPDDVIDLTWRGVRSATNGGAFPDTTPDKPYLTDFFVADDLRLNKTSSIGGTADFKLGPRDTLSLSTQYTRIAVLHNQRTLTFFVNRVAPGDFSTTYTHGAVGAGEVRQNDANTRYWLGNTSVFSVTYRHDGRLWKAELGAGNSNAHLHTHDTERGIMRNSQARRTGVTVAFDDINGLRPERIAVTDAAGQPVDPSRLDTYVLTSVDYQTEDSLDYKRSAFANLRREFYLGDVPLALKAGADVRQSLRDLRSAAHSFNFVGRDGKGSTTPTAAGSDDSAAPFLDVGMSQRPMPYGFPRMQVVDNMKVYQHFLDHPTEFTSDANAVYRSGVGNSKRIVETVTALYLRADAAFFRRRLQFVGGLRAEQTNDRGEGPLSDPTRNYQRDATGEVLLGANGRPLPIRTDALGISQLTYLERGQHTRKEYLRLLPNLNASYNVRENLIARASYYYSVGRPNLNQYAGGLTLPDTEADPSSSNRITVNNAGIKAWQAKTAKVRLEYYFQSVGQVSLGAFRRDFRHFFGSIIMRPTAEFLQLYDLDPDLYGRYDVSTNYNIPGTVRMTGLEFAYRQALTFLPPWARGLQVFANLSAQRATGSAADNFNGYIPRTANWGCTFARSRYSLKVNWNYRGKQRQGEVAAGRGIEDGSYNYGAKRLYLDVSGEYQLRRNLALFASIRNIGNATEDTLTYGPNTPGIARFRHRNDFKSAWTFGVKGSF